MLLARYSNKQRPHRKNDENSWPAILIHGVLQQRPAGAAGHAVEASTANNAEASAKFRRQGSATAVPDTLPLGCHRRCPRWCRPLQQQSADDGAEDDSPTGRGESAVSTTSLPSCVQHISSIGTSSVRKRPSFAGYCASIPLREASKLRHESIDKHREVSEVEEELRSTCESSMRETDTAQFDQLPPGSAAARPYHLIASSMRPKTAGRALSTQSTQSNGPIGLSLLDLEARHKRKVEAALRAQALAEAARSAADAAKARAEERLVAAKKRREARQQAEPLDRVSASFPTDRTSQRRASTAFVTPADGDAANAPPSQMSWHRQQSDHV